MNHSTSFEQEMNNFIQSQDYVHKNFSVILFPQLLCDFIL